MKYAIAILFVVTAFAQAQEYEIGGDLGYGFYRNGTIYSAGSSARAGIRNRFAAGFVFGDEFSDYFSAEIQYLYQDGHPFLEAPGIRSDIQGQSHTFTYNLLFHFKSLESRWRPFVAGGAGAKYYEIAGPEPFPQPIPQIASLTTNDVWKTVFSLGGGVKFRPRSHVLLRAEFRDYLTTFPRTQILPAPHNTARGIFQQFTPLFGVDYVFGDHRR